MVVYGYIMSSVLVQRVLSLTVVTVELVFSLLTTVITLKMYRCIAYQKEIQVREHSPFIIKYLYTL